MKDVLVLVNHPDDKTPHYEVASDVAPVVLANRLGEKNLPDQMYLGYRGMMYRFHSSTDRSYFVSGIQVGLPE